MLRRKSVVTLSDFEEYQRKRSENERRPKMSDPKEWGGKFDEDDAAELTESTVAEVQEAWHAARDDAEDDDDNVWEGDRHAQDEDVEEYEDDPWDGEDE